jgi:hypothetical protein
MKPNNRHTAERVGAEVGEDTVPLGLERVKALSVAALTAKVPEVPVLPATALTDVTVKDVDCAL